MTGPNIDLHTHTTCSDGSLSPVELLQFAVERGVEMLSITDHDTLAAYSDALGQVPDAPMLIPGLEVSAAWQRRDVHILGLNVDLSDTRLREPLMLQWQARKRRAERIAHRLARRRIEGALEGARRHANGAVIGRPHFAAFLVEHGVVPDMATAFKKYLGTGKVGDVRTAWPQMDEAIRWITQAGGVAVLAHPGKYGLTATKLRALVADFKTAGGAALEVVSGLQQEAQTRVLADLCNEAELLASRGSDFHHRDQRWADLGRGPALPRSVRPVWSSWT
ncbi:MAG: PHP domain-containing protein [Gammaproteobacteria bacterium]